MSTHKLSFDCPADIGLYADRRLVKQMLRVLLDNAVKYSNEDSEIKLTVLQNNESIDIVVKDSGIGIVPDELPHIFERFYRVDKARDKATGGAGLGLSIAQWIARAHYGEIHVESTPGEGSTFMVCLPCHQFRHVDIERK